MKQAATRRIPLIPLAGLGTVLIAGIFAILVSRGVAIASRWTEHSARVQLLIAELGERASDHESAFRGYIYRGDARMLADLRAAEREVSVRLAELKQATTDNPRQQQALAGLAAMTAERFAYDHARIAQRMRQGPLPPEAVGPAQERAYALSAGIRRTRDRLIAEEDRLATRRRRDAQWLISLLSVALGGAVLLIVIVAWLMIDDARARYRSLEIAHDDARAAVASAEAQMIAREEAEEKLRQSQKMESIGQLTGGIAHDFNNMLAVIIGGIDMARRRINDRARLLRSLDGAQDGAERAATLVARLLAFSRRQPLTPRQIEPNVLIGTMIELLERSLGEQVAIETRLADDLWPTWADPVQLENAILNLAVNARDAMGEGGGTLRIATANRTVDAGEADGHDELVPGDYARIAVIDDGSGMDADTVARAFDPFFTTKVVGKGTGLGLSQVFGFVKQSGGHVTIESEPGHGTTIGLLLPRFRGDAGVAAESARVQPPNPATSHERILVVEDDERVRRYSAEALAELGYLPIAVEHGAAALELLGRGEAVDLLFTDVVMPGMSGPQLAMAVRAMRPSLPILYTTGYARDGLPTPSLLERNAPILPKPFTVSQLAAKVREMIDAPDGRVSAEPQLRAPFSLSTDRIDDVPASNLPESPS